MHLFLLSVLLRLLLLCFFYPLCVLPSHRLLVVRFRFPVLQLLRFFVISVISVYSVYSVCSVCSVLSVSCPLRLPWRHFRVLLSRRILLVSCPVLASLFCLCPVCAVQFFLALPRSLALSVASVPLVFEITSCCFRSFCLLCADKDIWPRGAPSKKKWPKRYTQRVISCARQVRQVHGLPLAEKMPCTQVSLENL